VTQGTSLENLKEHLFNLCKDLSVGAIPNIRQHFELVPRKVDASAPVTVAGAR
jgi:hypothetical protein